MPDPFARLIPEARAFLSELARNNSRDWFAARKPDYDARLKGPAMLLLDQVTEAARSKHGLSLKPKLFRPHRDVRFSKDKTPYHTHLHMLWSVDASGPGLFFGISPDYVRLGGGVMGFDKAALPRWRDSVDRDGAMWTALLSALAQAGFDRGEPDLKRVPVPYPSDHAYAELLRHKALTVWRDLPEAEHATPLAAIDQALEHLAPLFQRLTDVTRP